MERVIRVLVHFQGSAARRVDGGLLTQSSRTVRMKWRATQSVVVSLSRRRLVHANTQNRMLTNSPMSASSATSSGGTMCIRVQTRAVSSLYTQVFDAQQYYAFGAWVLSAPHGRVRK